MFIINSLQVGRDNDASLQKMPGEKLTLGANPLKGKLYKIGKYGVAAVKMASGVMSKSSSTPGVVCTVESANATPHPNFLYEVARIQRRLEANLSVSEITHLAAEWAATKKKFGIDANEKVAGGDDNVKEEIVDAVLGPVEEISELAKLLAEITKDIIFDESQNTIGAVKGMATKKGVGILEDTLWNRLKKRKRIAKKLVALLMCIAKLEAKIAGSFLKMISSVILPLKLFLTPSMITNDREDQILAARLVDAQIGTIFHAFYIKSQQGKSPGKSLELQIPGHASQLRSN